MAASVDAMDKVTLMSKFAALDEKTREARIKEVGKFLRATTPSKEKQVEGRRAAYSSGRRILDTLMASKYSLEAHPDGKVAFLPTRKEAQQFCQKHMIPDYFHRGFFQEVTAKRRDGTEKKKKNLMPYAVGYQHMVDDAEPFIWTYEPQGYSWLFGGLMLAAIGLCVLLPLWPAEMRVGVHYVSMSGLGLIGVYFGLQLLRLLIFVLVWICTGGNYHFWALPNLNDEKLGVVDSFKPAYEMLDYYAVQQAADAKKKKKRKPSSRSADSGTDEPETPMTGDDEEDGDENTDDDANPGKPKAE